MSQRFNHNNIATIKRLVNEDGKSTYSEVGECIGRLYFSDSDQNSPGLQTMAQGWLFEADADVDIRESDRLTIDEQDYIVRGKIKEDFKREYFIRLLLEKPNKKNQ